MEKLWEIRDKRENQKTVELYPNIRTPRVVEILNHILYLGGVFTTRYFRGYLGFYRKISFKRFLYLFTVLACVVELASTIPCA